MNVANGELEVAYDSADQGPQPGRVVLISKKQTILSIKIEKVRPLKITFPNELCATGTIKTCSTKFYE